MTTYPGIDPNYYSNSRPELVAAWGDSLGRVLDIGCGTGALGVALLDAGCATSVSGVEVVEQAAREARRRYETVFVGDIEHSLATVTKLACSADTVILADVLEHLRDPWTTLRGLAGALRTGKRVLVSIPNVGSVEVLVPLALGRFTYRSSGILDHTHLRFFTRRTATEMLKSSGLVIERVFRTYPFRGRIMGHHPFALLGDRGARQFVFTCHIGAA